MIKKQVIINYNKYIKKIFNNNFQIYRINSLYTNNKIDNNYYNKNYNNDYNYNNINNNNINENNNIIINCNNINSFTYNKINYCTTSKIIEKQQEINKNNKTALKKFFLKVHPDLFFQFPNIKKTNDKSLSMLHSFLEEIKTERLSRKQYDMQFYYLDNNVYDNENDIPWFNIKFSINISSSNSFDKIAYHLQDAQEQIQQFFKLLSIKEEFILHSMIGNKSSLSNCNNNNNDINLNNDSLLHFVKNLSNFARETSKNFIDQEREIDLMYTYFYMEHKIRVLFQDHNLPLDERKKLLKKLEKLLNKLSPTSFENIGIVNQIFQRDENNNKNQNNGSRRRKRNDRLESFDLDDDEIDRQGDRYQGFGQRLRNSDQETKQEIMEQFSMFSGSNKNQFSGWQHIKSGYITPESNPKQDDSKLSDRLEGVSVVFSSKLPNGVDSEGRLILNTMKKKQSTLSEWTKTIETFKPSTIIENIRNCKNRQSTERQLAKYFKVGFIFTDYEKQNDKQYLQLLDRLISIGHFKHQQSMEKSYQQDLKDQEILLKQQLENNHGIQSFTKNQFQNNKDEEKEQEKEEDYNIKGLEEISLKIIINDQKTTKSSSKNQSNNNSNQQEELYWKFDPTLGVINVPLNANYQDIIQFLKLNHESIKKEFERHKINMRNIAQLELTFKRQFRLLTLKKIDESITLNEMVSCLRRLLFNHQPYLPYFYGMKVIIGRENKINPDGSIVIKWDFEL
ncbi:hypothetical protein ACTFIV_004342 [Dictyostelium citrinum]